MQRGQREEDPPVLLEELVERAQFGQLHDQHEVLRLADADHADDVGVVQLLHEVGLPQHLLPHRHVVVVAVLQDLHRDLLLRPGVVEQGVGRLEGMMGSTCMYSQVDRLEFCLHNGSFPGCLRCVTHAVGCL